jgi:hypothetical protein
MLKRLVIVFLIIKLTLQTIPEDSKSLDTKPEDSKILETEPEDSKTLETKPEDSKILETESEDSKILETEHVPNFVKFGVSVNNKYHVIDEVGENLSPKDFIDNYVQKNKPVLFRNMVKDYHAIHKWSDTFLMTELEGYDDDYEVFVEHGKRETRELEPQLMKMKDFLNDYQTKDLHMVSSLPDFLRIDVILPIVFQCEYVVDSIERIFMDFSSGGTQSVIHTDDEENLLCAFNGNKKVVIVDPKEFSSSVPTIIDSSDNTYSSLNIDKFDINRFDISFYLINLNAGDCLYIPKNWIRQIDTFERNIDLLFKFNNNLDENSNIDSCSDNSLNPSWTLNEVLYDLSIDKFITNIIEQVSNNNTSFKDMEEVLANEVGLSVDELAEFDLSRYVEEIFNLMDTDLDENISINEASEIEDIRESLEKIYTEFYRHAAKVQPSDEMHEEL